MNSLNPDVAPPGAHPVAEVPESPTPRQVDPDDIIRLWILRLASHQLDSRTLFDPQAALRPGSPPRRRRTSRRFPVDLLECVSAVIGFEAPEGATDHQAECMMRKLLKRRVRSLEKRLGSTPWLDAIDANPARSLMEIAELLGLNHDELLCLAFLLMLECHSELRVAASALGPGPEDWQEADKVAAATGLPLCRVQAAFSNHGRLISSSLIRLGKRSRGEDRIEWVFRNLPQEMMLAGFDPLKALRGGIVQPPAASLTMEQFSHLGELREIAVAYLRQALDSRRRGGNILLHGDPGVGKSEFTRTLARELGCSLYEVSAEDAQGDSISGENRLQALRFLGTLCSGRRCMVVFDEIEDVFPRPGPFSDRPAGKGWLNRTLETNTCITFWLTNLVEALDPAFVRRFDLVLEMKNPTAAVREAQLRRLPVSLPEAAISRLAACPDLTPAVANRAAGVADSIQSLLPRGRAASAMELIVNQTLRAQGFEQLRASPAGDAPYNPAYINSDIDLEALAGGIRSAKSARLCLLGPPGAGKTACARWIARQLDMQIHAKSASDLLSRYLGGTEKLMARAFREAQEAGAVLLVDEVDSFLQERSKARVSWEITQVNEFLTQMEQFQGVFIASTNQMDGLDAAALRRFDLKARFGYLRPEQSRGLLAAHLAAAGVAPADPPAIALLDSIQVLTPGDFAAVARQHRFRPLAAADAWVSALEAECSLKPAFNRRILGFGTNTAP